MELTFNKVKDKYEAEFEITNDANLHIEFKGATPIKLYQKTAGNNWDLVTDNKKQISDVIDVDLVALVYPKWIKVVSEVEVTMGVVTFNA